VTAESAHVLGDGGLVSVPRFRDWTALIVHGGIVAAVLGLAATSVIILRAPLIGFLLPLILFLIYGWLLYAFFHYRQGRQEEFLHLLTAAAESGVPLAPAVRSYLSDRPQGPMREAWVALLLFPLLPGYYWFWYRERRYDQKVEAVAFLLEQGTSLPYALQAVPGVAPRESMLAATLGQATGKLALCLRNAAQSKLATLWLEIVPRFLYPFLVLSFLVSITEFWLITILPRMQRIFMDFGMTLPEATQFLFRHFQTLAWGVGLTMAALIVVTLLLLVSSTVRWYFPILGRLYRRYTQGQVLKVLAVLLEAGKPAPEAFGLLIASGYFSRVAVRRLRKCRRRIEQGDSLVDSLRRGRLLPRHMAPLVRAAERARNLPWALAELGENLTSRTLRLVQRISMVVFPLLVLATGLVVVFIVLGMFMPLIDIIGSLNL
jgi:type II secretory pathway component PulF